MVKSPLPLTKLYKGWPVISLSNRWINMKIAPALGGRIMQISLSAYPFLFVNPALAGIVPGANGLSAEGTWLNFGGEKIWPAPQGWDLPGQWPGPPDPVLDSGAYTYSVNHEKGEAKLTSPPDPHTGLQIGRSIFLVENKAEIRISVAFSNTGQGPAAWSVWPVIQMNADDTAAEGRYQVTCPLNTASRFKDGYSVMHGLVNNPQFSPDDHGNLLVNFRYLVGKAGLDSTAGWMAYCDLREGKVMVARQEVRPEAEYPENTSFQVWTQGRGMIYSRNRIAEFSGDPAVNPPYLEMELLGPLEQVPPGGQIHFEYRLQMCTIAPGFSVRSVTENSVIAEPLTLIISEGAPLVKAKLGFFIAGVVKLQLLDQEENEMLYEEAGSWAADPGTGLDVYIRIKSIIPEHLSAVKLLLYDQNGMFTECIGEAR